MSKSEHKRINTQMKQRITDLEKQLTERDATIALLKDALGKATGWNWLSDDECLTDEMAYCLRVHDDTTQSLADHDAKVREECVEAIIDCEWHPEYGIDELIKAIRNLKEK